MSNELVGYSTPGEGYVVHDNNEITWGDHPGDYNGSIIFIRDDNKVTAVGREATLEQQGALQERSLPWDDDIPYAEALVTADNIMDAIIMLKDGVS